LGEADEEPLVRRDVVEDAGKEARLARGRANRGWIDSACGEERREPLGLAGEIGKRLNRKAFRSFAAAMYVFRYHIMFSFP